MGRYLKAAFFAVLPLSLLGNVPVNVLAVLGFAILGFGHPGFWMLGLGLEVAYLFTLTSNARFRRAVDTRLEMDKLQGAEAKRRILIEKLNSASRRKLELAEEKSRRILQTLRDNEAPDYVVVGNVEALSKLLWTYLKLLFASTVLENSSTASNEEALRAQCTALKRDIEDAATPLTIRQSKQATLEIVEKRLENVARRDQSAREIESDLARIEAQLGLGLENAAIRDREQVVDFNLDLASHLMDTSIYGDSGADIADVDEAYNLSPVQAAAALDPDTAVKRRGAAQRVR
jgi:hypothetical protein